MTENLEAVDRVRDCLVPVARALPHAADAFAVGPLLQKLDESTHVCRDDLLPGGSKTRFLPQLIEGAKEVVFGGPFCGGAPLALAVLGAVTGQRVTLFFAKRGKLHPKQEAAKALGAKIVEVSPGYMTVVQKRARDYAQEANALFLPLGFDVPRAAEPFVAAMRQAGRLLPWRPDEVWCATGSGMLARCLGIAFPESRVQAVAVGLQSRHGAQNFTPNVKLWPCRWKFEQENRGEKPPFPSCPNYDAKAWDSMARHRQGNVLFWNVAPPVL